MYNLHKHIGSTTYISKYSALILIQYVYKKCIYKAYIQAPYEEEPCTL